MPLRLKKDAANRARADGDHGRQIEDRGDILKIVEANEAVTASGGKWRV